MRARLVDRVMKGIAGKKAFLNIPEGTAVFGRGENADVNIHSDLKYQDGQQVSLDKSCTKAYHTYYSGVSREHFMIYNKNGELKISDDNSSEGTYIHRGGRWQKLTAGAEPIPLVNGDKIKAGIYEYVVRFEDKIEEKAVEEDKPIDIGE